jgi:2-oxoglutarate ferredoxin oxidoreductase subunit alpha
VYDINFSAIEVGANYAREHLKNIKFPFSTKELKNESSQLLIDGNSAAALGAVAGGCTFLSWYPITPSSSLAESFQDFAAVTRDENQKENRTAVVQAEDELSAINMVIGAGWAGSRAMTATSGPGLSLMSEAAGLSYFAEVPAVIWDVQRAGPSTGLPTRTMQGDLQSAAHLSHGDTEHIVLLPANPQECFEFAQMAFDLSEELQTLVIVLSDLDLGMNLSMSPDFQLNSAPYKRGKVLSADALNSVEEFARYKDVDGDGIPYRTLPGTKHAKAAYFTRGTGHTEKATYSEDGENYHKMLARLKRKFQTAQKYLPAPITQQTKNKIGIIAFGSSDFILPEVQSLLSQNKMPTDYLRVRSLPLNDSIADFLKTHETIFVVEQNRDGQLKKLMAEKFIAHAIKLQSVLSYDGMPLAAEFVAAEINKKLEVKS